MTRILVAGGTGSTGRKVVSMLLARGDAVRVLTRRADSARALFRDVGAVEVHQGDIRHADTLRGVASDVDVVVSAVGTRTFFGSNGSAAVDAVGTKNLATAVASEGSVSQLILLSAFGVDRHSVFLDAFSLVFNQYFRWKANAEQSVRESGLPYTIVRPVEFSFSKQPTRNQARLNQTEPLTLLRTINRELVAQTLVACVGHADALNKTFELCEGSSQPSIEAQLGAMRCDDSRSLPARTPLF